MPYKCHAVTTPQFRCAQTQSGTFSEAWEQIQQYVLPDTTSKRG